MDTMEDSGFDSDQKSALSESNVHENTDDAKLQTKEALKAVRKASELQRKIEKQREKAKRSQAAIDQQPKRSFLLPIGRLSVPGKTDNIPLSQDQQPLVAIVSDDSEEDEFDVPRLSRAAQKEITQQLIKDGYNLDLEPDDEDLDLIPPRPLNERFSCCNNSVITGCAIQ